MSASSTDNEEIKSLERINQIVDLCIDRDLFKCVDEFLTLSRNAQECLKDLEKKNEIGNLSFEVGERPVQEVKVPTFVRDCGGNFSKLESVQLGAKNNSIYEHWSQLFWAKLLRAQLQKYNRRPWSNRYDDLVALLERHMPLLASETDPGEMQLQRITAINFLMELSATALGSASMGYAQRARKIVTNIINGNGQDKKDRDEFGTKYDRWIWYNTGLAYQHMGGMPQQAVLEFNAVISKFRRYTKYKSKSYDDRDTALEFLLNVVPATMQRASIQLQLQLSYHALETIADKDVKNWLEKLANKDSNGSYGNLFSLAVVELHKRRSIIKLEALIQLGELKQAKEFCEGLKMPRIFDSPPKLEWKEEGLNLPGPKGLRPAVEIRLIEETMHWHLEKARNLLKRVEKQKNLKEKRRNQDGQEMKDIEEEVGILAEMLVPNCQIYWEWAKDNEYDEMVFFSRWAQLLGVSSDIAWGAAELDLTGPAKELLDASLKLYKNQRNAIPMTREERRHAKREYEIELENLKSDDLPDLRDGLSRFYENISSILMKTEKQEKQHLKALKDAICSKSNCNDLLMDLKKDHYQLLGAINEWDREFGENQRVACLERCNQALIWSSGNNPGGSETGCSYREEHGEIEWKHFKSLLKCTERVEANNKASGYSDYKPLVSADYESIMQMNEEHLTEHLEIRSHHPYGHLGNPTLHFIGLQRWNSSTPAQGRSVGGGYLLYRTNDQGEVDLGIAIDPGFDFVRNLFNMGFSLRDIDIVLISHAHPDHLWDFESIVQLLHELEEKRKVKHQLHTVLTLGSYRRLEHVIMNPVLRQYINPLIIDIRKEIKPVSYLSDYKENPFEFIENKENEPRWIPKLPDVNDQDSVRSIQIRPTLAYHDDYSGRSDSFGFIITFTGLEDFGGINRNKLHFGYTGDTKWVSRDLYDQENCPLRKVKKCLREKFDLGCWPCVAEQYSQCDVVLMHLGSLIDHKAGDRFDQYDKQKCEGLLRKKQHPYLMGTIRFLNILQSLKCYEKLILIGEFGEELRGGIRADLMQRLKGGVTKSWPVLPVDVGLDILLYSFGKGQDRAQNGESRFQFLCAMCEHYRPISDKIKYPRYGQDEAIYYMCDTCYKATPEDVRQNKLSQLYDIGRELKKLPNAESS